MEKPTELSIDLQVTKEKSLALATESCKVNGFKNSATILIVICLINVVVYFNLLIHTLRDRDVESSLILVLLLLCAIIIELIGLGSILCQSHLIILLYIVSLIIALICMFFMFQLHIGAVIITIASVISCWRCYYVLRRAKNNKSSTGWRDSTIRQTDRL